MCFAEYAKLKEFMNRGCHENYLDIKMAGQPCFAKVNYYHHSIRGNRFIFMEEF